MVSVTLGAALLLVAAAVQEAPHKVVDGRVDDALYVRQGGAAEVWLTLVPKDDTAPRELLRLDARSLVVRARTPVAAEALFIDACPGAGADDVVVLADARGAVDASGKRLVEAPSLFAVPDPMSLAVGDLCGDDGDGRGELRLPVRDGLAVARVGAPPVVLAYRHMARAYSGRVHKGLRPDRPYAEALSLYAPRFFDADVDGDRRTDLVAVREGRLVAYLRGSDGVLARAPAAARDLVRTIGASPDADLRVRVADLDGDGRGDAVIGVTEGAVPERSEAWVVPSTPRGLFDGAPRPLWKQDGLIVPLDVVTRRGAGRVVAGAFDTSLMSLSSAVVTGKLALKVSLWPSSVGALSLTASLDVRGGKMGGAMPVTGVDFDGDGTADLLDLGEPGAAVLHRGVAEGYDEGEAARWTVPAFVNVVPMPRLPGVLLVGAPDKRGKTSIALLTIERAASSSSRR